MESQNPLNLVMGPPKSGKSVFCHFISDFDLKIIRRGLRYETSFISSSLNNEISENPIFTTSSPQHFENLCDFPSLQENRVEEKTLISTLELLNELQRRKTMRIILVVEEAFIIMSNGSCFLNFTSEVIEMFNLSPDHVKGMIFVVSKTSSGFTSSISNYLNLIFTSQQNFIIEAIKRSKMRVMSFSKPHSTDSNYSFQQQEKIDFQEELKNHEFLETETFFSSITQRVDLILNQLKHSQIRSNNIVFTSEVRDNRFSSDLILCIDSNREINSNFLSFDAPFIYILPSENSKTVQIEVAGQEPLVEFSENVKKVIKGKSLHILIKPPNEKIDFPDPFKKFKKNTRFFRLESICVNGNWTEYASHNNKFIELIVYLNPEIGKVDIKPEFEVKVTNVDIRMKLLINECMKTKKNIMEKFISIRFCRDLDEYLLKCKKIDISEKIRKCLEDYLIKLPNIFQIFMKVEDLGKFAGDSSEKNDLLEIQGILLKRYMKIITKYQNSKLKIKPNECLNESLEKFQKFCRSTVGDVGGITVKNKKLVERLLIRMNGKIEKKKLTQFFSFFDYLINSIDKEILFQYQITGDLSIYANYSAFKQQILNAGNGLLFGAGVSIGLGAFSAGRYVVARGIANTALRASIGTASVVASVLGAVMLVGDIGINLIVAAAKSGYYKGEFQPDLKDYFRDRREV
jgi:hypothetical protein